MNAGCGPSRTACAHVGGGKGLGIHTWGHWAAAPPVMSRACMASPNSINTQHPSGMCPSPTSTHTTVGHSWHLCWRRSVAWVMLQLPWCLLWERRDLHSLRSRVQEAFGTPKATLGPPPFISGPADGSSIFPPIFLPTPLAKPRQRTVPMAVGGDILDVEDSLTGVSRCRRQGGASVFPESSQPKDAGSSLCSPTPQLVLLNAHEKPLFPIPKETYLTSTCNISASSAVPAPEDAHVLLWGCFWRVSLTHSHGNLLFFLLCGQNSTLWGRFLQCLQLIECSSARLDPSWCQSMFPMNVTLL